MNCAAAKKKPAMECPRLPEPNWSLPEFVVILSEWRLRNARPKRSRRTPARVTTPPTKSAGRQFCTRYLLPRTVKLPEILDFVGPFASGWADSAQDDIGIVQSESYGWITDSRLLGMTVAQASHFTDAVESCHAHQQPPQGHRLLCRAGRLPGAAGDRSECWLDHPQLSRRGPAVSWDNFFRAADCRSDRKYQLPGAGDSAQ